MEDKRKVSYEEGEELARSFKISFLEVSAKTSTNIDQAFKEMAKNIMLRINATSIKKDFDKKKLNYMNKVWRKRRFKNKALVVCFDFYFLYLFLNFFAIF